MRVHPLAVLGVALVWACPPSGSRPAPDAAVVLKDAQTEEADSKPIPRRMEQILEAKELRILSFSEDDELLDRSGGPAFQDEAIAASFARQLGVEPVIIRVRSQDRLIPSLLEGRGDLIASQLTVTSSRADLVAFSQSRLVVDEVIVARKGAADAPRSPEDLAGREVHIRPSSSYHETLTSLDVPIRIVSADERTSTVELLLDVAEGRRPLTAADSNLVEAVQSFEGGIEVAFVVARGRQLAWAVRPTAEALRSAVDTFVQQRALTRDFRERYTADLDEIRERGVLRVITRNNAINYFLHRGQQFGFEYALAQHYADELGVRLQMVVAPSRDALIPWLLEGRGDVVAASLTDTPRRREKVRFSRPYLFTTPQVVRKQGTDVPGSVEQLAGRTVHVRRSSAFFVPLQRLREGGVDFEIAEVEETMETEEILGRVAEGTYELTVADQHVLEVERAYGVAVESAFPLVPAVPSSTVAGPAADSGEGTAIAFALRPQSIELAKGLDAFVQREYRGLRYNIAKRRYFEDARRFATARAERVGVSGRISPYDDLIRRYSKRYRFDWRLMAAQAYVESRFDPNAKSWVGALGLFQVMPRTGRSLGFTNLTNPEVGIHAGIKYMSRLLERFDPQIPLEVRTRFALAAYNAGLGHLFDARRLAAKLGMDPDKWFDNVEQAMLKLSQPKYARQARHGYCRGGQPVAYVRHISKLYDAYVRVAEP